MTAGAMLLEAAAQAGWYACMTRSLGPQIRGGEAAAMLRFSATPVESHGDRFDALLAIDWGNAARFADEIPLDGESLTLGDPKAGEIPEAIRAMGAHHADLALVQTAKRIGGGRPNMVALGVIAALLEIPDPALARTLERVLARKGPDAIEASRAAVAAGQVLARDLPALPKLPALGETSRDGRWQISGNEAVGLGALRGGVRFVAAYPITPATEVLEWLAPRLQQVGGVLVQAEDELASINQIIGASFGGVPSLTATYGPGLALMTEGIGLAVGSETPVVVVDVMRGGPSTGIPTKSEQTDLNIALYGLHGDAPHLVVAPNSVADCLFTAQWATHLAESLQTAAILLSDQALGQTRAVLPRPATAHFEGGRKTMERIDGEYLRYATNASGVSPMSLPGVAGGHYTADGLEHNPHGTPSSLARDHIAQLDKRRDKLLGYDYGEHWAQIEGDGSTAIVTWGSSTAAAREALTELAADGHHCRLISLRLLSPTLPEKMDEALAGVTRLLVVEQSHDGQFHRYLRAHYDLPAEVRSFCRPGPLPMRAIDIRRSLQEWS